MAIFELRSKRKKVFYNARRVKVKVKSRIGRTIIKPGKNLTAINAFISDQNLDRKILKTTKFIKSEPVVIFEGEPPF